MRKHTRITLEDLADRCLFAAENGLTALVQELAQGEEWAAADQQSEAIAGVSWAQYLQARRDYFDALRAKLRR